MSEIRFVIEVLRRRWLTFAGVLGGVWGFALLFLLVSPKKYEVEGELMYRESPLNLLAMGNLVGGALSGFIGVNPTLETQLTLLSSLDLFHKVTQQLPSDDIRYLTRTSPIFIPIRWLKRLVFPKPGHRPPTLRAAYRLQEDMVIEPVGAASVIRVAYQDVDQERAIRIVKAYIQQALDFSREVQKRFYRQVAQALVSQVQQAHDSLSQVEEALASFQAKTGVFSPEVQVPGLFQQLLTLEGLRGELEGRLAGLQAQGKILGILQDSILSRSVDNLTFLESPTTRILWDSLVSLQTVYIQLRAQGLSDTSTRLIRVSQQIRRLEQMLREALQRNLQEKSWGHPGVALDSMVVRAIGIRLGVARIESQLRVVQRELSRAEDTLRNYPPKALTYVRLYQRRAFFQQMWATLEQQRAQMEALADAATPSFLVIQHPVPPVEPVSPNVLLVLVAAFFLGGLLAVGGVFTHEFLSQRVYTPHEVETLLGIPVICEVDRVHPEDAHIQTLAFLFRKMDEGEHRFLVTSLSPHIDLSSFFQSIQQTSVSMDRPLGLILFESSFPPDDLRVLTHDPRRPGGNKIAVGDQGLRFYESSILAKFLDQYPPHEGLVMVIPSLRGNPHGLSLVRKVDGVLLGVVEETPVEMLREITEQIHLHGGHLKGILFIRHLD